MPTTIVATPDRRGRAEVTRNVPRAFRVARPPALEPPFDDEREANAPATWATRRPMPSPAQPVWSSSHTPATSAAHAAGKYVQVCLEVLNGFRPPSHLRTLAGPIEFADTLRQLRRRNGAWRSEVAGSSRNAGRHPAARADACDQRAVVGGLDRDALREPHSARKAHASRLPQVARPVLTTPNRAAAPNAFRLLRLRVTEPLPGKAEAVAVIAHADTSVAIAMRLEASNATWVCTVFQVV